LLGRQVADPNLIVSQGYSAIPGLSGGLIPLTTSWAWAITTTDPIRQPLAADLITFLTAPENLANWSSRSQILPARREAMALLADQNPYYRFAAVESERAQVMPVSETSRLLDVIGDAVFQVLTTETPTMLVAEQAVNALRQ
jgi:ABC-type glycerol-3-phosphate transport system substrate-binding protein